MSVATSPSIASPRPPSPGGRHRSRPSFAIGYSQPSRLSTASSSPWPLYPQPQNSPNPPSNPSLPTTTASPSTTANPSAPNPPIPPVSSSKHFVVPAHPQSHHLHTLPPREKTTRTLILDHTAWRQGRTRFAQGRCELGMAVKFKNGKQLQQQLQHQHQQTASTSKVGQRPGFYIGTAGPASGPAAVSGPGANTAFSSTIARVSDFGDPSEVELASSDDDDDGDNDDGDDGNGVGGGSDTRESDGEGVHALIYGKHYKQMRGKRKQDIITSSGDRLDVDTENSGSDTDDDDNDDNNYNELHHPSPRNPSLAPLLAARATGIEKVLQAMLAQPPSSPPRSPSPSPYALHSSHAGSQHYLAPPQSQSQLPLSSSSSPSTRPSPQPTVSSVGSAPAASAAGDQSCVLPNGLRLRLALMALVNDLFERQPPPGEQQQQQSATSATTTTAAASSDSATGGAASDDGASSSKSVSSGSVSSSDGGPKKTAAGHGAVVSLPPLPPPATALLPPELAPLAEISCQPFYVTPSLPSFHTLTLPLASSSAASASSNAAHAASNRAGAAAAIKGSVESGQSSIAQQAQQRPPPPLFSWTRPTAPAPPSPLAASSFTSPRSATPSTHDKIDAVIRPKSPTSQSLTYPSSWKRGARRNQSDKCAPILIPNPSLAKRARGRAKELFMTGCYAKPSAAPVSSASTSSFRRNAPMYNYSSSTRPPNLPPGYPLKKLKLLCPRHLREQCRICTRSVHAARGGGGASTRIGAGLLKKTPAPRQSSSVLAELIPRFLRLSALVAMELGREARGEEPEANDGEGGDGGGGSVAADKPDASEQHPPESPLLSPVTRAPAHAQPTRGWFALLCGLLTRAVLEGYVARDWKGSEYAEVILGVGLGIKGIGTRRGAGAATAFGAATTMNTGATPEFAVVVVEEPADELEPDEMPRLVDAGKVLFGGLVQDVLAPGSKDKAAWSAEDEYVVEMEERLSEFLTVSHTMSDLATHFTQLSEKYPAEPVERAALRFCEAVAKWRGKPELEMYKKHAMRSGTKSKASTPLPLSIESLLASTPTPVPHRPPIDRYFRVPPRSSSTAAATAITSRLFFQHQSQPQPQHPHPHPPPAAVRALKRQRSVDELERERKKGKVDVAEIDLGRELDEEMEEVQEMEEVRDEEEDEEEDEAMQDETGEWVGPYGV